MAIFINIKKFSENDSIYYYVVSTNDFGQVKFYIGIDPNKKKVLFFNDSNFKESPVSVVDLSDPENQKTVGEKNIFPGVAGRVLSKAYESIVNQFFPDDISWCS